MVALPITDRSLSSPLLSLNGRVIKVDEFLGSAAALAQSLSAGAPVINLCESRAHFSIGFAAALMSGAPSLLPANRLARSIDALLSTHPDACVLADCAMDQMRAPVLHPGDFLNANPVSAIPEFPAEQLAAVVFTSGSTGCESRINKPWSTLYHSSRINHAHYGPVASIHAIATVPPQHMWGLETSVLMPWFAPITMHDGQPFFAADVVAALEKLPEPRMLISTPFHLRVLSETQSDLPAVQSIYSATAPLSQELAACLESRTGGQVSEVYGCSETGCLAHRFSARGERWRLFDGFDLNGGPRLFEVNAAHLPAPVRLMDQLAMCGEQHFELVGRSADLVNIAGKRASLAALTNTLLEIPGVIDGVIFQPPEHAEGRVERLAAFVVAPNWRATDLRQHLSERIDAAFMPRPLRLVDALPRAESGKLPQRLLFDFFHQNSQTASA